MSRLAVDEIIWLDVLGWLFVENVLTVELELNFDSGLGVIVVSVLVLVCDWFLCFKTLLII